MDPRTIERLVGIDVAHTRNARLVEEGYLHWTSSSRSEAVVKDARRKARRDGVWPVRVPSYEVAKVSGRHEPQPPETSLVVEPKANIPTELEEKSGRRVWQVGSRTWVRMPADDPRTVRRLKHQLPSDFEVHREGETIGKPEQDHLACTVNGLHHAPDDRPGVEALTGVPSLLVKHGEACHRAADNHRLQTPAEPLNLRQLGHRACSLRAR
jgi:hypothetical protein